MKYILYSARQRKNDLPGTIQLYLGNRIIINSKYMSYVVEIDKGDYNRDNIMFLLLNPSSEVFQKVIRPHFNREYVLEKCEFLDDLEREYYKLKYA